MHDIAVIGASWAGLACAIAAAAAGARVEVFEPRSRRDEAPLPVDIVPNMMRALAALGLAERCVRQGFPYRSVAVTDAADRLRIELPCARLGPVHLPAAAGLTQQALSDTLVDAALARGVRLNWAAPITAMETADTQAVLHQAGQPPRRADLVILAQGDDSTGFHGTADDEVPWWSGLIRRPAGLDQATWVLAGPRRKALLLPVSGDSAGLAVIDAQLPADGSRLPAAELRPWLRAQGGRLAALVPQIDDTLALLPLRVRPALHEPAAGPGPVLRVGDAAYRMPLQFGQAAAQALDDAVVLGELLATLPDLRLLPPAFAQRRQPRLQAVFDISARASRWDRAPDGSDGLAELSAEMAGAVAQPA